MRIDSVRLQGLKSFGPESQAISLGDVTVLLGANGSGKSNLVSFFGMLGWMMTGSLRDYVGRYGANRLLHYGTKHTETLSFTLHLSDKEWEDTYEVKLSFGLPDRLFVSGEHITCRKVGKHKPREYSLGSGGSEMKLPKDEDSSSKTISYTLNRIKTYQFHDTSDSARIKGRCHVNDAAYLRSDAGNLAPFLKMLKEHPDYSRYYQRIVRHIQKVMPQFKDFDFSPVPGNESSVYLNWTDRSQRDYLFDPGQISDGSLRFMALATLFLQPPDLLPKLIVIDEPELGLHPTALMELSSMIRTASKHAQILIATQSTRFVDEFGPEQIVVIERDPASQSTHFKSLPTDQLKTWLEDYSLSELWEKNVLGGQP